MTTISIDVIWRIEHDEFLITTLHNFEWTGEVPDTAELTRLCAETEGEVEIDDRIKEHGYEVIAAYPIPEFYVY